MPDARQANHSSVPETWTTPPVKWPFSSRRTSGKQPGPAGIQPGPYRSPGFTVLCDELDKHAPSAILDLGAPSTESLEFLSGYCSNVSIRDLFRSVGPEPGSRLAAFRFEDPATLELAAPAEGPFDVILAWDLLHYFSKKHHADFVENLLKAAAPGSLILILASAVAPITPTPLQFKIARRDSLIYTTTDEMRVEAPGLRTRVVEQLMIRCEPLRYFQLRNGLQEFLFRYPGPPVEGRPPGGGSVRSGPARR